MATLGEATVKVNFEVTDTSKALIRGLIAEVLKEELMIEQAVIPFASHDALRAFVRAEVRKALGEVTRDIRMQTGVQR